MRLVRRDFNFKLLNEENFESVFDTKHKYFISGEPQELAKNRMIFFVMKDSMTKEYEIVGTAKPILVRSVNAVHGDEDSFSEQHS